MKNAVFWVVAPCSLGEVYQRALLMEAARTSETLVNFYQTTRCYNPEDSHLQLNIDFLYSLTAQNGHRPSSTVNSKILATPYSKSNLGQSYFGVLNIDYIRKEI
jgi:hypothetical protein